MIDMNNTPFQVGDRVWNTGNTRRDKIGVVTDIVDDEYCNVFWSDGTGYAYRGTIRRDGTVQYGADLPGHEADRVVRVQLIVLVPREALK